MNGIVSPYLTQKRAQACKPYLAGKKKILDIGSGLFKWENMLDPDTEYVGVDSAREIIRYNREISHHKFHRLDAEQDDLWICGSDFDLVLMIAVIEHFKDPQSVLQKLKVMLGIDGTIILTTPHPVGDWILNSGSRFGIFSSDKHTHHNLLNYGSISRLACCTGLCLVEYKRFLLGFNQLVVLKNGDLK